MEAATKIRGKYLEALELDDFEVLPGSTCVKGFLRTYATFLKLDADGLVEAYKATYESPDVDSVVVRAKTTQPRKTPAAKAPPRMSAGTERQGKRTQHQQRGYALATFVAIVVVVLLAWFGSSSNDPAASIGAENIAASTASTETAVVATTTTPATIAETQTPTTAATTAATKVAEGGSLKMVITVTKDSCWVVVREDSENGAEVYAGTLSAGGKQTFEGANRYWMMVGQPEALVVSVGDKSYILAAPAGAFVVTAAGVERSQ